MTRKPPRPRLGTAAIKRLWLDAELVIPSSDDHVIAPVTIYGADGRAVATMDARSRTRMPIDDGVIR